MAICTDMNALCHRGQRSASREAHRRAAYPTHRLVGSLRISPFSTLSLFEIDGSRLMKLTQSEVSLAQA